MLHQRLALAGVLLLFAVTRQAEAASLVFAECVNNCVASSGCESKDTKCICTEDHFLKNVATCMSYHCKDELRAIDNLFFNPVKSGCEADKKAIPKKELDEAKKTASSLVAKLPKSTTATVAPTKPATITPKSTSTLSTSKSSSLLSSSSSSLSPTPAPSPNEPSPAPTVIAPPPTSTLTLLPGPTTTALQGGRQGVPTDSSPFAAIDSPGSRFGVPWLTQSLLFAIAIVWR